MKKVSSRREPVKPAGRGKTKNVYRVSNWAAYNQALVQRGNLTVWLDEAGLGRLARVRSAPAGRPICLLGSGD